MPKTEKELAKQKLDKSWLKFRKKNTAIVTKLVVAQYKEKQGR